MTIRAALFDMDGTIYEGNIDWLALREEIDIPWDGRTIISQLAEASPAARERGLASLHRVEAECSSQGSLIDGAEDLLMLLKSREVPCALVTNNSRQSADRVLSRFALPFDVVLTRDDGPTKPDPDLLHRALRQLGVDPEDALFVGDAHLDLMAAHAAGIPRTILVGTPDWMREHIPAGMDYTAANDLHEVRALVQDWL